MSQRSIRQCKCADCQTGNAAIPQHQQLNLVLSRLDEQQRRWVAGWAAAELGHGGIQAISQRTGLDLNTIRRGRRELAQGLVERPVGRIRAVGGGRKRLEKKV